MKLKFIHPDSLIKNLKATVHKTGKLGFTADAARKLDLQNRGSVSIAFNEEEDPISDLYMKINISVTPDSFKISKAGDYYYVNIKALLDNLKWDYLQSTLTFDITEEKIAGEHYYKLSKRKQKGKLYTQSSASFDEDAL